MHTLELRIPPKALLVVFGEKNISTGMTYAAPGSVNLTLGGMDDLSFAQSLIPVTLSFKVNIAIGIFSGWLRQKLDSANVRHIRLNGVEMEATSYAIAKTIIEFIDADLLSTTTTLSEEEIVASKDVIICLRVPPEGDRQELVQNSAIRKCSRCQSDVLIAPSTETILAHGENEIVCMECWTEANSPSTATEERQNKLRKLEACKRAGEQAYDDMYEKAHSPSDTTAFFSNAKESFCTAIELARELDLKQEVETLQKRLDHIKAIFRGQFS